MLYGKPRKIGQTMPMVEDDKWEALARIASLLPESDIELQHAGGHAVVSRRLSDGVLQPWGVAPLPEGHPRPSGREFNVCLLSLMDQALADATSRVRSYLGLCTLGASPADLMADRPALR